MQAFRSDVYLLLVNDTMHNINMRNNAATPCKIAEQLIRKHMYLGYIFLKKIENNPQVC